VCKLGEEKHVWGKGREIFTKYFFQEFQDFQLIDEGYSFESFGEGGIVGLLPNQEGLEGGVLCQYSRRQHRAEGQAFLALSVEFLVNTLQVEDDVFCGLWILVAGHLVVAVGNYSSVLLAEPQERVSKASFIFGLLFTGISNITRKQGEGRRRRTLSEEVQCRRLM